jgi:hypothetical protein
VGRGRLAGRARLHYVDRSPLTSRYKWRPGVARVGRLALALLTADKYCLNGARPSPTVCEGGVSIRPLSTLQWSRNGLFAGKSVGRCRRDEGTLSKVLPQRGPARPWLGRGGCSVDAQKPAYRLLDDLEGAHHVVL